jgi:hypothetical protein
MASFETIPSGIAQHAGTYVDALSVSGVSRERPKNRPGGRLVRVAKLHDLRRRTGRTVTSRRIHLAGQPQPRTAQRWRTRRSRE